MSLSRKAASRVGLLVISLFMSGVMSAVMTLLNSGSRAVFWSQWVRSWGIGLAVSLPVAALVVEYVGSPKGAS